MGLLWRTVAPRPLKKARRLVSPTQLIADAVQPKAVKQARRVAYRSLNPIEGLEGLAGDAALKARCKRKPSRRAAHRSSSQGTGILLLVIVGLVAVVAVVSGVSWAVSAAWNAAFSRGAPGPPAAVARHVGGEEYGVTLTGLRFSKVTCRWNGDHVQARFTVRNTTSSARVLTVSPEYKLPEGEHGASVNDYSEHRVGAHRSASVVANAGPPHDGSQIIEGQPQITECGPMVVEVETR